jgi:predicted adenylyl cyclase CyaB
MNRNVEIKARVDSLAPVRDRIESLHGKGPTVLRQEDTFFVCPTGRLKLRQSPDSPEAELIYYKRANLAQPKETQYIIHRTRDGESLKQAMSQSLGIQGVVRKRRELFLVGQTRVHLDEVEGLGTFVELEVVLRPDQSSAEGTAIATKLMQQLGISGNDLIDGAYIDLLGHQALL